ncbi:fimbrial protein [Salmonella enterica]|nr:fimbrial protein [Salmonella enterica]
MKTMKGIVGRYLVFIGLSLWFIPLPSKAGCEFTDGSVVSTTTFNIPALTINEDTEPGTVLYEQALVGNKTNVRCHGVGAIYQGYTQLTSSDKRADNPLPEVYQTNVPGIGIQTAWNNTGGSATLNANNLIIPWHIGSANTENKSYVLTIKAGLRIVVTGPVSSGVIDTSQLQADWKYDDLVVEQLRFSPVTVNVKANTCNLVESNITVPLRDIMIGEIHNGFSDVVSDSRFKIQLEQCDAGLKVDYKFTSAGSTGVSGNSDILTIADNNGAAQGVGLQILDSNNNVLQFDREYNVAVNTSDGQSLIIPLQARYIQTGPVKAGKVDSVATFEVFYR